MLGPNRPSTAPQLTDQLDGIDQLEAIERIEAVGDWRQALQSLQRLLMGPLCCGSKGYHVLGRLYQRLGRHQPARRAYQQALALQPQSARTYNNLALLELAQLNASAADSWLQRGLQISERCHEESALLYATGSELRLFQLRAADALIYAQAHLALSVSVVSLTNLAGCLHQLARFAEARDLQEQAVARHLQDHAPHLLQEPLQALVAAPCGDQQASDCLRTLLLNLGLFQLCLDPFDRQGQALLLAHDATDRAQLGQVVSPWLSWKGDRCQRLTLWDDQGYGDTLQNLGWVLQAAQRADQLELWLRPSLLPLVRSRFRLPGHCSLNVMAPEARPWAQEGFHLGLYHLPMVLGAWSPAQPPDHLRGWVRRPRSTPSLPPRIGLVWSAGRHPAPQPERSARLRDAPFGALWALAQSWKHRFGAEILSLHLDSPASEAAREALSSGALMQGVHSSDWLATAEVLETLDAVVSVDTSLAHLAGVLGVPCCLMLPAPADWRWGQSGNQTWLYPSVALARCREPGNWSAVWPEVTAWMDAHLGHRFPGQ